MKSSEANLKMPDFNLSEENSGIIQRNKNKHYLYFFGFPLIIYIIAAIGFAGNAFFKSNPGKIYKLEETKGGEIKNAGKFNILSSEDIVVGIKDTVYTDKDCWLELRIDQQMLYQHWRDGRTEKYPVSTGNNHQGDPKALESRPGLFAIFSKELHHVSSQFDAADMYNYMPFNQGIGFHSLNGTGYYGSLGIRPASHGCIRMKHEDVKKLYGECELGTLVLASKGHSARAIAFAPVGFENPREYTKEEYKRMLANNLYNLMHKRYYMEEREKFVVDPKVIPASGVYTSYDVEIPDKQLVPRSFVSFSEIPDNVDVRINKEILKDENSEEIITLVSNDKDIENNKTNKKHEINSSDDLVKQYFNNPIGILPYFGPKK
jgi:L,D-transpeptidase catalytic domain